MKYLTKPRFWRLFKFCLSALFLYFFLKTPMMWLMTDVLHVHYIWSGAIAGAIITLAQFFPIEHWIWKGKKVK